MSEPLDKKVNTDSQNEFKEKIINAIKLVYDPEIPVDVYELGLIYEINIFPINNVHIPVSYTHLTLPTIYSV